MLELLYSVHYIAGIVVRTSERQLERLMMPLSVRTEIVLIDDNYRVWSPRDNISQSYCPEDLIERSESYPKGPIRSRIAEHCVSKSPFQFFQETGRNSDTWTYLRVSFCKHGNTQGVSRAWRLKNVFTALLYKSPLQFRPQWNEIRRVIINGALYSPLTLFYTWRRMLSRNRMRDTVVICSSKCAYLWMKITPEYNYNYYVTRNRNAVHLIGSVHIGTFSVTVHLVCNVVRYTPTPRQCFI